MGPHRWKRSSLSSSRPLLPPPDPVSACLFLHQRLYSCPANMFLRTSFPNSLLLLLLLSCFSRVRLCATPQTAAHQAPPSLGFSRQEHWSGLPFPSAMHESESEVTDWCPTLHGPMDCSLPGSSVHGIFQARVLEWDAIAFSRRVAVNVNKSPTQV